MRACRCVCLHAALLMCVCVCGPFLVAAVWFGGDTLSFLSSKTTRHYYRQTIRSAQETSSSFLLPLIFFCPSLVTFLSQDHFLLHIKHPSILSLQHTDSSSLLSVVEAELLVDLLTSFTADELVVTNSRRAAQTRRHFFFFFCKTSHTLVEIHIC